MPRISPPPYRGCHVDTGVSCHRQMPAHSRRDRRCPRDAPEEGAGARYCKQVRRFSTTHPRRKRGFCRRARSMRAPGGGKPSHEEQKRPLHKGADPCAGGPDVQAKRPSSVTRGAISALPPRERPRLASNTLGGHRTRISPAAPVASRTLREIWQSSAKKRPESVGFSRPKRDHNFRFPCRRAFRIWPKCPSRDQRTAWFEQVSSESSRTPPQSPGISCSTHKSSWSFGLP